MHDLRPSPQLTAGYHDSSRPSSESAEHHPLRYLREFRGHATWLDPGVLLARASAPATESDHIWGAGEARLEWRMTFVDEVRFEQTGTIGFSSGHALRFRSIDLGVLEPSPDAHLRHGAVTWRIDGGTGVLLGVNGKIVSNVLVSDSGDLTEHQLGLLFLSPERFDSVRQD